MLKTVKYAGLQIVIENPVGSVRKGVNKNGEKWQVEMPYAYGYVKGTEGTDGDEVDVFCGPNERSKWVFIVHQLQHDTGKWDEDKVMLGFNDAMQAKQAYLKSYDGNGPRFYGTVEAITLKAFKEKVFKTGGEMIHASKLDMAIQLSAVGTDAGDIDVNVGDPVTVDGLHGRGMVVARSGRRVVIRFRSGLFLSRDIKYVHNLGGNMYKSQYQSGR